jgi:hypothetical protein
MYKHQKRRLNEIFHSQNSTQPIVNHKGYSKLKKYNNGQEDAVYSALDTKEDKHKAKNITKNDCYFNQNNYFCM